ncbi:MAG: TlpA disulfide reductase family protein [Myxococcota bacterium]|nr:TlpA disulfide reductase family protein [Myxococcota bacterium]
MTTESETKQGPTRLFRWALVVGCIAVFCIVTQLHMTDGESRREVALAAAIDLNAQVRTGIAPDFEVIRADGSRIRLSSLRGKVVFINFWATWCPPCRAEIPDLEKLADKMKHVPFEILAVSSDESWADVQRFFAGKRTKMLVGLDPNKQSIATSYGTEKLPETYVVDRDGNLRLRFVNVQPWTDSRIHRYLEWLATKS